MLCSGSLLRAPDDRKANSRVRSFGCIGNYAVFASVILFPCENVAKLMSRLSLTHTMYVGYPTYICVSVRVVYAAVGR